MLGCILINYLPVCYFGHEVAKYLFGSSEETSHHLNEQMKLSVLCFPCLCSYFVWILLSIVSAILEDKG